MSVWVKVSEYLVPECSTLEFPLVMYMGHWFEGNSRKDALERAAAYFGEGPSEHPSLASIKARGWEVDAVKPFREVPAWASFDDKEHSMRGGRLSNPRSLFGYTFDINDYVMSQKNAPGMGPLSIVPRMVCKNGVSLSVQAGSHTYCFPRVDSGPWDRFEVGYPSVYIPELMPYIENNFTPPTDSVYPYVPASLINIIIDRNGGPKWP